MSAIECIVPQAGTMLAQRFFFPPNTESFADFKLEQSIAPGRSPTLRNTTKITAPSAFTAAPTYFRIITRGTTSSTPAGRTRTRITSNLCRPAVSQLESTSRASNITRSRSPPPVSAQSIRALHCPSVLLTLQTPRPVDQLVLEGQQDDAQVWTR